MHIKVLDTDTGHELWAAWDCAEFCGISTSTWHSYSRYKRTPPEVARFGRTPLWDAQEVRAWQAARPRPQG